ncbi:MAG: hypothetical protein Athens071416_73 [Parcubacteria group bacterium Athens0714_16]|nr:MAG: hypothetical protein Athens071416_73 [Parcubacteria group bacterium Athens0714_16]
MIFEKIKKLKQKPVHTRKKIALGISSGVTGIIIIVWLSVFNLNSNNVIAENSQPEINKNSEIASPFSKIKDDFTKIFSTAPEFKVSTTSMSSVQATAISSTLVATTTATSTDFSQQNFGQTGKATTTTKK